MNIKKTPLLLFATSILFFYSCEILESVNTSDAALELYGDNPYEIFDGTANGCDGNDDESFSQGEKGRIKIRVQNRGEEEADDVVLKITTNDSYVDIISGSSQTIGDMDVGRILSTPDANTSGSILLAVKQGTPNGHIADFEVEFKDDLHNKWFDDFSVVIEPISASVLLYGDNPYDLYDGTGNGANGNDNGRIEPGETVRLQIRARDEGYADVMQVRMVARIDDAYVSVVDDSTYTFGDMKSYMIMSTPDANTNSALMISADSATPAGHTATIFLYFTDKFENQWSDSFTIIVQ